MTSLQQIHDFLELKRFAVVGVSRQPQDFSRAVLKEFLARGFEAVPVNPDADEIDGQLLVRSFRHGDRVQPIGMTGTRKVHDVFIDRKVPRDRRATWPIIESARGILWIPGMVRSRYALVAATTKNLLQLKANQEVGIKNTSLLRI